MSIPTQAQYEQREAQLHARKMAGQKRTIAEARQTIEDIYQAMLNPDFVNRDLDLLLTGSYGYGPMLAAQQIAKNRRRNRGAGLMAILAAYDHNANRGDAAQAWKLLNTEQQAALDDAILSAIDSWLEYDKECQEYESTRNTKGN